MIHNIYDNNDKTTYAAMGNKYYDGLIFYLPQLCMCNSYMGRQCDSNGIGFSCNPYEKTFADDIYQYYQSLDLLSFKRNCDTTLEGIILQIEEDEKIIRKSLLEE